MSTELYHCYWRMVAVSGPSFILSISSIYDSQQSTYPMTFTLPITFKHLLGDLFSRPNLLTLRYGNTSIVLNLLYEAFRHKEYTLHVKQPCT